MSEKIGTAAVILGLSRIQDGEPLATLIRDLGAVPAECAGMLARAGEIGAYAQSADDTSIAVCIAAFRGPLVRRRMLSHLRRSGVIRPEMPFYKVMVPGSAPGPRSIVRLAAAENGRAVEDVLGEGRRPESAMARFEAAWIGVRGFGHPITAMAEALGKNHTTLLSGVSKVDILIRRSPVRLDRLLDMADRADQEALLRHAALLCGDEMRAARP